MRIPFRSGGGLEEGGAGVATLTREAPKPPLTPPSPPPVSPQTLDLTQAAAAAGEVGGPQAGLEAVADAAQLTAAERSERVMAEIRKSPAYRPPEQSAQTAQPPAALEFDAAAAQANVDKLKQLKENLPPEDTAPVLKRLQITETPFTPITADEVTGGQSFRPPEPTVSTAATTEGPWGPEPAKVVTAPIETAAVQPDLYSEPLGPPLPPTPVVEPIPTAASAPAARTEVTMPETPAEAQVLQGLTAEAQQLLNSVDSGGVPAFVTANLRRVASENGVEVTGDMTPANIVDAIRSRGISAPPAEPAPAPATRVEAAIPAEPARVEPAPTSTTIEHPPAASPTGTATHEAAGTVVPAASPELAAVERQIALYQTLQPEFLQRRIDALSGMIETKSRTLGNLRDLTQMEKVQADIEELQGQLDLVQSVQDSQGGPSAVSSPRTREGSRQNRQELRDAAARRVQAVDNRLKEFNTKTIKELEGEESSIDARINAHEQSLNATSDPDEKASLTQLITDLKREKAAIGVLKEAKKPAETEAENKLREEETRVNQQQIERLQRERANSKELTTTLEGINAKIKTANEELARDDTTPERRAELQKQIIALEGDLNSTTVAFRKAEAAERDESGLMSIKAFNDADAKDAGKYLTNYVRIKGIDTTDFKYSKKDPESAFQKAVADLRNNTNMTGEEGIKKMALVSNAMVEHISVHGNRGFDMKTYNLLANQYPQIREAVMQRLEQSDAAKELKKKFPGRWESALKKARKHPGWMSIILLLIAGAVIGQVRESFKGG